jgi:hypothetical protein
VNDAYKRVEEQRSTIQADIQGLNKQLSGLKRVIATSGPSCKNNSARDSRSCKELKREKEYSTSFTVMHRKRQQLFRDYESLRTFATNFSGRSYNIDDSADRQALRVAMLRSLRPPALKILEEVAATYHAQFGRPLPSVHL